MGTDAIEKKTMGALVTERLRRDILQGRFSKGEHLTVQNLSAMYATSAIPVREAFSVLSGEDLLEIIPYKGVIVRGMDWQAVESMYDVMRMMEILVTEDIIGHWTPDLRKKCAAANEKLRRLTTDREIAQNFGRLSRAFHDPLEQFCTNRRALRLRDQYREYIDLISQVGVHHTPERVQAVCREHDEILAALDSGDKQAFSSAYMKHTRSGKLELMRQLEGTSLLDEE